MARAWLAVGMTLVAAVASAGCSDRGPDAAAADDDAGAVVHGVVVDEAIRPLANATVDLTTTSGLAMSTVTGAEGLFRFVGLPGGIVVLTVSKAFYSTQQVTAQATLDEAAPAVKVELQLETGTLPFANLAKWEGFLECSASIGNWCGIANLYPCIVQSQVGQPCTAVSSDESFNFLTGFFMDLQRIPTWLQMEAVWESTQSLSTSLSIRYAATNQSEWDAFSYGPVLAAVTGPSPLIGYAPGPGDIDVNNFMGNGTRLNESELGLTRGLTTELFHGPPDSAPDTLEQCGPELPEFGQPCWSNQFLGVAAQQRISIFYIAFYGYAPPAGWTFTAGGDIPPPPA